MTTLTTMQCPIATCRAENILPAELCVRCGIPLQEYTRLLYYPARLFNAGLSAVREGHMQQARDSFAAVVQWYPRDSEARNALAMACFALHDWAEARQQWEIVLVQVPQDVIAQQGLAALATQARTPAHSAKTRHFMAKAHFKKKRQRKEGKHPYGR